MKLSIIIPVFNERQYIQEIVRRVGKTEIDPLEKEIILIDDGSDDGTRELLKTTIEPVVDKIIYKEKNMGKGAAIKSGLKCASGEIILIQDADLEYDPNEYTKLLEPILNNNADVVFGSRFAGGEPHRVLFFWHYVGNKMLTVLSNMFTNLNLTDMECCYKLFRREVLDSVVLDQKRFGIEPEITAKVAKRNWRIYEVGISYFGRTYAEGKKANWKDGMHAVWCIFKYNLWS